MISSPQKKKQCKSSDNMRRRIKTIKIFNPLRYHVIDKQKRFLDNEKGRINIMQNFNFLKDPPNISEPDIIEIEIPNHDNVFQRWVEENSDNSEHIINDNIIINVNDIDERIDNQEIISISQRITNPLISEISCPDNEADKFMEPNIDNFNDIIAVNVNDSDERIDNQVTISISEPIANTSIFKISYPDNESYKIEHNLKQNSDMIAENTNESDERKNNQKIYPTTEPDTTTPSIEISNPDNDEEKLNELDEFEDPRNIMVSEILSNSEPDSAAQIIRISEPDNDEYWMNH